MLRISNFRPWRFVTTFWCHVLQHLEKTSNMIQNTFDFAILLRPLASFKRGKLSSFFIFTWGWFLMSSSTKSGENLNRGPKSARSYYISSTPCIYGRGKLLTFFFNLRFVSGIKFLPNLEKTSNITQNMYEFVILLRPLTSFKRGNYRHFFFDLRLVFDVKFYQI